MDLLRTVARPGRVVFNRRSINLASILEICDSCTLTQIRPILDFKEAQDIQIGGNGTSGRLKAFRPETRSDFGVDAFRQSLERRVKAAFRRIVHDLFPDLVDHGFKGIPVGGPPGFDPAPHILDILGEIAWHVVQACNPGLGGFHAVDICPHRGKDRFGLKTPVTRERDAGRISLRPVDVRFQQANQDRLIDDMFGFSFLHIFQKGPRGVRLGRNRGRPNIRPAIWRAILFPCCIFRTDGVHIRLIGWNQRVERICSSSLCQHSCERPCGKCKKKRFHIVAP